ncbi:helix-turn-helix transcriptional regulator [Adlercreutzia sp. ZJ304]|uniref:response regulator transcription factor n=1 Tax=Adlercreutzia sp. ZJ304 TaxID=2709791 RepID=UPI0013EB643F|nr:helix-turn-helix transcriptional regulator [Adlercreutzia sp. ZJ304]
MSPQEALALIGYGSFIGWFFLCAFSLLPSNGTPQTSPELFSAFLISYFSGSFLFILLSAFTPITIINKSKWTYAPITAILSLLLPAYLSIACQIGESSSIIIIILSFITGCATSSFYYLWDSLSLRIRISSHVIFLCVSLMIGCGLYLIAQGIVLEQYRGVICIVLAFISSAIAMFLQKLADPENDIFFTPSTTQDMPKIRFGSKNRPAIAELNRRIRLVFFLFGIAFGIGWIMLVNSHPLILPPVFIVIIFGTVLLIALFWRDPIIHDRYVTMLMRVCIIVIGICFLMALVLPGLPAILFLCTVCAFWQIFWVIDTALLLRHAQKYAFSILKHTSTGKLSSASGFLIGLICATICAGIMGYQNTLVGLSCTVIIVCIICSMTLLPFSNTTLLAQAKSESDSNSTSVRRGQQTGWEEICQRLVTKYHLSPREGEILECMARGHNNKTISEELVVSEHTVKSHVYNIYQKMGIHSRQEMFDALEKISKDT